jgi:Ca2+-binding RTX toxin-like protein
LTLPEVVMLASPTVLTFAGVLSGDDYLESGFGDDILYGADGNDPLYGGDGNESGSITGAGVRYLSADLTAATAATRSLAGMGTTS